MLKVLKNNINVLYFYVEKRGRLLSNQNDWLSFQIIFSVLRSQSRSRKELHLLVGAGAGAVTRCGSGGSGSDNGNKHGGELKNNTKCNSL
jgi:hypothetical protein